MCSDYARLITGCDFVVDGGARAKNFAYFPAAATEVAGPIPLIPLDVTGELDQDLPAEGPGRPAPRARTKRS